MFKSYRRCFVELLSVAGVALMFFDSSVSFQTRKAVVCFVGKGSGTERLSVLYFRASGKSRVPGAWFLGEDLRDESRAEKRQDIFRGFNVSQV